MFGGAAFRGMKPNINLGGARPVAPPKPAKQAGFGGVAGNAQGMASRMAGAFGGAKPTPMQQPPKLGGSVAGSMKGLLSDKNSKERIRELEGELDRTYAALDDEGIDYPETREPDRDALDDSYRRASSNEYEYKDPEAPGAAPGRHVGPMAHELEGLPGVVEKRPDGMKQVNAGRLTLANTSELGEQRRELDDLHAQFAALSDDPDEVLDLAAGRKGGR